MLNVPKTVDKFSAVRMEVLLWEYLNDHNFHFII